MMTGTRIISFLPAATEMVFALGAGDLLHGVSHECDFPPEARTKPVVVKPALPFETMTLSEIDATVAERIKIGKSLYEVDESLLEQIAPTHILTQQLCQVCAPSGNEVTRVLAALPAKPQILWFSPHSIEDIFDNMRELGAVIEKSAMAESWIAAVRAHLQMISEKAKTASHRPRVFCLEWVDPYYCCGHWVPEMIEIAGGEDALGRRGKDSARVSWADVEKWAPEILIVSPCGFDTEKAVHQAEELLRQPGWSDLPAVRNERVYAVNANAYFARPGPRVVDGMELLAHLIHPELFFWYGSTDVFQNVTLPNKRS